MDRMNGAEGTLAWPLCSRRRLRECTPSETELGVEWGVLSLAWGAAVLVPVVPLMMVLGMTGLPGRASIVDVLAQWAVTYGFALLAALTGAVAYLPLVCCAASRWPRAGRAIALACTPIVALGVLPWGMERMLLVWNVGVAVAAGLLFWAATLPLPAVSRTAEEERRAEVARGDISKERRARWRR